MTKLLCLSKIIISPIWSRIPAVNPGHHPQCRHSVTQTHCRPNYLLSSCKLLLLTIQRPFVTHTLRTSGYRQGWIFWPLCRIWLKIRNCGPFLIVLVSSQLNDYFHNKISNFFIIVTLTLYTGRYLFSIYKSVNGNRVIPRAPSFLDYKLGVTQTYLLVTRVTPGRRGSSHSHFLIWVRSPLIGMSWLPQQLKI